jgi:hypothetical protein
MFRASEGRIGHGAQTSRSRRWMTFATVGAASILSFGCGDKTPPPSPPCEQKCQDGVALRALREMMKFAFNQTFQGKPVGFHDETTDRFLRGSARVSGRALAIAEQGVTDVDLTYVFTQALYAKKEDEPEENYVILLDGTITQFGNIAVQPSSPTSLTMETRKDEFVTIAGTVYDPPINYIEMGCALKILQNGNSVAGMFCASDRWAGFGF